MMEQVRVTTPDGLNWFFERDRDARVAAETNYNGARTSYVRDGLSRVLASTDALGVTHRRSYSVLGQLEATVSDNDGRTEYSYDAAGDLVGVVNAEARVELERDIVGRVVAERVNGVSVASRFDVVGRRTDRVVASGGGVWSSVFGFDAVGELAFVDAGGRYSAQPSRRVGFGYDGSGREAERRFGGSARMRQGFDVRGRLARQQVTAGGPVTQASGAGRPGHGGERLVAGRSWSYRPDGYVSRVDDAVAGSTRFDLDGFGRVTAAVPENPEPPEV